MKRILVTFFVLFALLGVAAVMAPKLVSTERIAAEIKTRVKEATGRDIAFSSAQLFLWPNIGVTMTEVTFGNAPWAAEKNMAEFARLDVRLALLPLLHKQVEMKRFEMKAPRINLEIAKDGKNNWTFGTGKKEEKDAGASASAVAAKDFALKLGEFRIESGAVSFIDRAKGASYRAEDIDLVLNIADLESPLDLDGALTFNKKRVTLAAYVESPLDLVKGKASTIRADFRTEGAYVKADGVFSKDIASDIGRISGKAEADIPSVSQLLAWLGLKGQMNVPVETLAGVKASAEKGSYSLSGREIALATGERISDIDIKARMEDPSRPATAEGALSFRGQKIAFSANADNPGALLAGKTSKGGVTVRADDFDAAINGDIATAGTFLRGDMAANIRSLSRLRAFATGADSAEKAPFETVSFKSLGEVSKSDIFLKGAQLKLDDISARGDVAVKLSGRPNVFARLEMDKLALDRFTGVEGGKSAGASAPKAAAQQGWDQTPIDFSGLTRMDADLALKTAGFSLKDADVGPSTLTVALKSGVLKFSSSEASLFGGRFRSDLSVNATAKTPVMSFSFMMAGVEAKPILTTFANFRKLSGKADAAISVMSSGNSQQAIVGNLSGDGSVTFRNGALEGIDLANIAKMIQSRLTGMGVGEGKTDFVELGGTFTITQGVAANSDLKMRGPLVQATGQGTVDLPQKRVDYRVVPVLTASSAVEGATGLEVPVDIAGPFSAIKVRPDYQAAISNVVNNPDAMKGAAKVIREQGRDLRGVAKEIKKDPAKALNAILGGGLFGPAPQPPQDPSADAAQPETAPQAVP